MSDKDFTERTVFLTEFPQASLLISLFHTLRSMRREVTCEKLGLHPGDRDNALEILTKLTYSKSLQESKPTIALKASMQKSKVSALNMQVYPHSLISFFAVLACLRNERDHITLMATVKKRVGTFAPESP